MKKKTPPPADEMLAVKNLSVQFGSKKVLSQVNLALQRGESLAVIGASGSGKSVLFKSILGLLEVPYQGHTHLLGIEVKKSSPRQIKKAFQKIGMLFQYSALFDSLPLWQNVAFQAYQQKLMPVKDAKEKAIALMERVGVLAENADLYPAEISGGMKKRVGLARALFMAPELLFIDEPTSGLDPLMCRVIDDLILENVIKRQSTAITITHDIDTVKHIASRVVLLHQGNFAWQGTPDELMRTDDPLVRDFVTARL